MNMKILTTLSVSLLAFVAGCVSLAPEIESALGTWVGAPVVEFFEVNPEPTSMVDLISHRVYKWDSSQSGVITTAVQTNCGASVVEGGAPSCYSYGGTAIPWSMRCAYTVTVDPGNQIIATELIGADCSGQMPVARYGVVASDYE